MPLKDVLAGTAQRVVGGPARVRLVTTATPLTIRQDRGRFPRRRLRSRRHAVGGVHQLHLRDESRRIEQKPLKEQPDDFKALYTPEFADQLFVKYFRDGKWSEPMAVTGPKEDLVRCAIAVEGTARPWVAYSANRKGRHDIYARAIDKQSGKEQKLTRRVGANEAGRLPEPVCVRHNPASLHLAFQTWIQGRRRRRLPPDGLSLAGDQGDRKSRLPGFGAGKRAVDVAPRCRPPMDELAVACDGYRNGDYDIPGRIRRRRAKASGDIDRLAASSRFEARPSLCYDAKGRLWIAYEEGPEKWGKDYGALDGDDGNPLYSERSVRVVCLEATANCCKPAAELPTSHVQAARTRRR